MLCRCTVLWLRYCVLFLTWYITNNKPCIRWRLENTRYIQATTTVLLFYSGWNLFQKRKKIIIQHRTHLTRTVGEFSTSWSAASWRRRGTVSKTENKLSPSTDYYRGRCLEEWWCVLRNMCGLVLLHCSLFLLCAWYIFICGNQVNQQQSVWKNT